MFVIRRILIFFGIIFLTEGRGVDLIEVLFWNYSTQLKIYYSLGARECPEPTKAHLTRCDMYYRCTVLPSDKLIWIPRQCPNGLVFEPKYKNCVIPGEKFVSV